MPFEEVERISYMKRLMQGIFLIGLCSLLFSIQVSATSWVYLEPDKVMERASVIVQGTYDFKRQQAGSRQSFSWERYEFQVRRVYKGDVPPTITAGIHWDDVTQIRSGQEEGDEILLFLEKNDREDFLVPVGGPNGIVPIRNGEIRDFEESKKKVYTHFITDRVFKEPNASLPIQLGRTDYIRYGLIAAAILFVVSFFAWKNRRQ
ncbi:hypothetical protein AZ66_08900 [Paenibacillus sp. E194]|uniref:hypothetical protein n=1 Tax=Paenibacillus sp. E194 TaxID=1458845 RepID=UPI0005DE3B53|nr:hypothetical protein [Paenibacillus sp. E194]KJB88151.1 hypothetical protein AZ66_08900 [Paenibacillus sp. E194]